LTFAILEYKIGNVNKINLMKHRGIIIFAAIEIALGLITLAAVIFSMAHGVCSKPPQVLLFVLVTALTSTGLGIGILRYHIHSYHLLLYFSSVIILSKFLIYGKIISLSGALETAIPSDLKSGISIVYHSLLIYYFSRKSVRDCFKK